MAIMMGELRAALVDAGASDDLATRAATEVATYDIRLSGIDAKLAGLDSRLSGIDTKFTLMIGGVLTLNVFVLGLVLHLVVR